MKHFHRILLSIALGAVITGLFIMHTSASYSADREYLSALERMYETGMTKYTTSSGYNPGGALLREHAAKFFVQYAKQQGLEEIADSDCDFTDSNLADSTLQTYIQQACAFGIMRGSQGKYNPKEVMTKAQALTVLVRIESGLQNEKVTPWWKNNFIKARELGLTKETDVRAVDTSVTRYEMALLLSRAAGVTTPSVTSDPELEEALRLMGMLTNYLRTE